MSHYEYGGQLTEPLCSLAHRRQDDIAVNYNLACQSIRCWLLGSTSVSVWLSLFTVTLYRVLALTDTMF